ncbi:MAG TPA: nitrous oxide reductase accessory protein NosL [Nitrospirota bacterium]
MKRRQVVYLAAAVCLIFGGLLVAQTSREDIALHKDCKYCGMNRDTYDFSRMLIEYEDGTTAALCSTRCAAVELANSIDRTPRAIKVGDFNGKQLIDAEKAFWVVGGNKPGVMSKRGKWAFEKKEDAENFMKTNQGSMTTFEEAMKMAYEDMYDDTKTIRERRKMKRMKMMEQKN